MDLVEHASVQLICLIDSHSECDMGVQSMSAPEWLDAKSLAKERKRTPKLERL